MQAVLRAAAAYAGVVFALGFVFGTVRTLLLVEAVGPLRAVSIELPLILAAAYLVCRWAVRRWRVPPAVAARVGMGAAAFGLLMAAEIALSRFGFGQSLGDYLMSYRQPEKLLGLAGQLVFAAMPLLVPPRRSAPGAGP